MSFAKKMSNKYSQKLFDSAKKFTTDAILIGNKIADKITSVSKTFSQNKNELETPKERYISPEKRQQIIDELWLE